MLHVWACSLVAGLYRVFPQVRYEMPSTFNSIIFLLTCLRAAPPHQHILRSKNIGGYWSFDFYYSGELSRQLVTMMSKTLPRSRYCWTFTTRLGQHRSHQFSQTFFFDELGACWSYTHNIFSSIRGFSTSSNVQSPSSLNMNPAKHQT